MRQLAVLGTIGISFSAIFVRLAAVSPTTAGLYRTAYAVPVLLVMALLLRAEGLRPLRPLAWLAGAVFAVNLALWHISIDFIGTGLATVLGNTQVIFIALLGWLLLGERPTGRALILIPFLIMGIALLSGIGGGGYGINPVFGVIFGVSSGLTSAVYVVLFRSVSQQVPGQGLVIGLLLQASLSGAIVSAALGFLADPNFVPVPTWPEHGWLLLLALIVQVGGWLLLSRALKTLAALETAIIMLLQPVLAVFWGVLIFQEQPSGIQILGVLILLTGIVLLSAARSVRHEPPQKPAHLSSTHTRRFTEGE
jgi:drug/metabolite transporter (DMT)-like permease